MSASLGELRALYPVALEQLPTQVLTEGPYEVCFAHSTDELDQVLKLRFEIFNLELGEGLEASHETGRDVDTFDAACHHLMVRDLRTDDVVGCYRLQTSATAATHFGFYSQNEFDLNALGSEVLDRSVELGRACVAKSHRSTQVLFLLWKGLAQYAAHNHKRYLFGCSSLTSQVPADGWEMADYLERAGHMHPTLLAPAQPNFVCERPAAIEHRFDKTDLPTLFRAYLRYGATICSPPVIDRQFKTIDFLTLFDIETMPRRVFRRLFGG